MFTYPLNYTNRNLIFHHKEGNYFGPICVFIFSNDSIHFEKSARLTTTLFLIISIITCRNNDTIEISTGLVTYMNICL